MLNGRLERVPAVERLGPTPNRNPEEQIHWNEPFEDIPAERMHESSSCIPVSAIHVIEPIGAPNYTKGEAPFIDGPTRYPNELMHVINPMEERKSKIATYMASRDIHEPK